MNFALRGKVAMSRAGQKNRIEKQFLARIKQVCRLAAETAAVEWARLAFEQF